MRGFGRLTVQIALMVLQEYSQVSNRISAFYEAFHARNHQNEVQKMSSLDIGLYANFGVWSQQIFCHSRLQ